MASNDQDTSGDTENEQHPNNPVTTTIYQRTQNSNEATANGPQEVLQSAREEADMTHAIFQTVRAVELYIHQRNVAHYLELGYLNVSHHPSLAKEIRLTAQQARTQHSMTSGLMKKYTATSDHIVKTIIPLILSVVELRDKEVVVMAIEMVIDNANSMKKESEETRNSYHCIQNKLQNDLAAVNEKNREVLDKQRQIAEETEYQQRLAEAARQEQDELSQEKEQMEEELKALKETKERWMSLAESSANEQDLAATIGATLAPFSAVMLAGGPVMGAIGMVAGTINLFAYFVNDYRRYKETTQRMRAAMDTEERMHKMMKEKTEAINKAAEKKREELAGLAKLKKLSLECESLGDTRSLHEASLYLGKVDRLFGKLIQFWDTIAAKLHVMKEQIRVGTIFLDRLDSAPHTKLFVQSIEKAEKEWKFFRRICYDYVVACDSEIRELYGFLSDPVDHLTDEARTNRKLKVLGAIEGDIECTYGEIGNEENN